MLEAELVKGLISKDVKTFEEFVDVY